MKRQVFVRRGVLFSIVVLVLCIHPFVDIAQADSFGSGASSFEIEFVAIGDPGNPADMTGSPNPAGSVPYEYRIGKYEISEQMIDKANALGGLGITKDTRGPDKPATSVSWFEAAQFVNWLNTSTGSAPAYKFVEIDGRPPVTQFALWEPGDTGYDSSNLFRNSLARYFLPSADEWYKAAFYDPTSGVYYNYPTGSNFLPVAVASGTTPGTAVYQQDLSTGPADITLAGGLSPYGTMAQGGNVTEWEETELDLVNDDPLGLRGGRGGAWASASLVMQGSIRSGSIPTSGLNASGFRVASVIPEPSAFVLLAIAFLGVIGLRRHLRTQSRHYESLGKT